LFIYTNTKQLHIIIGCYTPICVQLDLLMRNEKVSIVRKV